MKGRDIRFIIPDDWVEGQGWVSLVLCVPDSQQWRGLVMGLLHQLDYGRYYDESMGSVVGALDVARRILGSVSMGCFEELAASLSEIAAAISSMQVNQSNSQTVYCGDTSVSVPVNTYVQGTTEDGTIIYGGTPGGVGEPGGRGNQGVSILGRSMDCINAGRPRSLSRGG